jgi:hypothetical protein
MHRTSFAYGADESADDPELAARTYSPAPDLIHREILAAPSAQQLAGMRARGVPEENIAEIIARAKASPKMQRSPGQEFAK